SPACAPTRRNSNPRCSTSRSTPATPCRTAGRVPAPPRREGVVRAIRRLQREDTGEGMDAATLARAAELFFTTKGVGKGTGLGLSMVHGLAAQSGGALALSSQPGEGTRIEIWIPEREGP